MKPSRSFTSSPATVDPPPFCFYSNYIALSENVFHIRQQRLLILHEPLLFRYATQAFEGTCGIQMTAHRSASVGLGTVKCRCCAVAAIDAESVCGGWGGKHK